MTTNPDKYSDNFNKNMDELRAAYKRFAAIHFPNKKNKTTSASRNNVKNSRSRLSNQNISSDVHTGQPLAYDPYEPQYYCPSYDG
jgi:hypothetical protein